MKFPVAGTSYTLDSIDLAMWHASGSSQSARITVAADNGGLPGLALDSAIVAAPAFPAAIVTAGMSGSVLLQNSLPYWVIAESLASNSNNPWNWSRPAATGVVRHRVNGGPWTNLGTARLAAFRVNGTVIPEPVTLISAGIALGGLGGYLRKRRQT